MTVHAVQFNLLIVIPDSSHNHIKFPVNGFVYNPGRGAPCRFDLGRVLINPVP
jgi:hypothetical protein